MKFHHANSMRYIWIFQSSKSTQILYEKESTDLTRPRAYSRRGGFEGHTNFNFDSQINIFTNFNLLKISKLISWHLDSSVSSKLCSESEFWSRDYLKKQFFEVKLEVHNLISQ